MTRQSVISDENSLPGFV